MKILNETYVCERVAQLLFQELDSKVSETQTKFKLLFVLAYVYLNLFKTHTWMLILSYDVLKIKKLHRFQITTVQVLLPDKPL